uniref:Zinc finger MYM-type protein 1-like n=1 Tax=Nicotiana tabacum TaxID=4097 RepID=A0A1S4C1Z9_TOBAC|nr:PREDICTED: uncharacterized protein LOC107814300 [Nicotiana tabacum]
MALVLCYVNKEGELIERFLSLVHVKGTTAHALQKEIYSLLLQHSLSSSLIRGQEYNGASNIQGNINGLKALILKDNPSAHCFTHQLQLTLVAVAKKHHDVNNVLIFLLIGFCAAIDLQLSELNSRFSEVNTSPLLGMVSLSPDDSFANYDKNKIMKLATYYPNEFTASKLEDLSYELGNYIDYVREMDNAFSNLKELGDLSKALVKINIHKTWGLVYLLVKLSLILPVATATVERAFSSMKFIKNDLRSRIGDDFLNDCLVCFIEDEVFESVSNDAIIDRFQNMTTRRVQVK